MFFAWLCRKLVWPSDLANFKMPASRYGRSSGSVVIHSARSSGLL
jgi:hypothetical protein